MVKPPFFFNRKPKPSSKKKSILRHIKKSAKQFKSKKSIVKNEEQKKITKIKRIEPRKIQSPKDEAALPGKIQKIKSKFKIKKIPFVKLKIQLKKEIVSKKEGKSQGVVKKEDPQLIPKQEKEFKKELGKKHKKKLKKKLREEAKKTKKNLRKKEEKQPYKVRVKVVGVGGAGGRIVSEMKDRLLPEIELIAINTDLQALNQCGGIKTISIGQKITRGLGTGMNPELGREVAEVEKENLQKLLKESDVIFIVAGLGGGTGSGASPVIAEIAKETEALVMGIGIRPFSFEGKARMEIAQDSIERLELHLNTLITISNEKLLNYIDQRPYLKSIRLGRALGLINEIIQQGIQSLVELIFTPGIINLDLADIKTIMDQGTLGLIGVGSASGRNRAIEAAKRAISSPLIDFSIKGARGILFNIAGKAGIGMLEIEKAARVITENANPETKIIFGATEDRKLGNKIKITLFAVGVTNPEEGKNAISKEKGTERNLSDSESPQFSR